MNEKLTKLFNTLCEVETKGKSTIVMSDCLRYLEQLINECGVADKEVTNNEN